MILALLAAGIFAGALVLFSLFWVVEREPVTPEQDTSTPRRPPLRVRRRRQHDGGRTRGHGGP